MEHTDTSKHSICLAAIKRKTIKPYNFRWTRFYESNSEFRSPNPDCQIKLSHTEMVICATILDPQRYSILTTQRLITNINGVEEIALFPDWTRQGYGSFKKEANNDYTFGIVIKADRSEVQYFIETGNASMIMIYGINTMYGFIISEKHDHESAKTG